MTFAPIPLPSQTPYYQRHKAMKALRDSFRDALRESLRETVKQTMAKASPQGRDLHDKYRDAAAEAGVKLHACPGCRTDEYVMLAHPDLANGLQFECLHCGTVFADPTSQAIFNNNHSRIPEDALTVEP